MTAYPPRDALPSCVMCGHSDEDPALRGTCGCPCGCADAAPYLSLREATDLASTAQLSLGNLQRPRGPHSHRNHEGEHYLYWSEDFGANQPPMRTVEYGEWEASARAENKVRRYTENRTFSGAKKRLPL